MFSFGIGKRRDEAERDVVGVAAVVAVVVAAVVVRGLVFDVLLDNEAEVDGVRVVVAFPLFEVDFPRLCVLSAFVRLGCLLNGVPSVDVVR